MAQDPNKVRKRIGAFIFYYNVLFLLTTLEKIILKHQNPVYFNAGDFVPPAVFAIAMVLFWGRSPVFNTFK